MSADFSDAIHEMSDDACANYMNFCRIIENLSLIHI